MAEKNKPWLQPSTETEQERAARIRLAKEKHLSLADLEARLEAEQAKAKQPKPKPSLRKTPEPKPLWPDVQPKAEEQPDPRLVEIARMWPNLSDRDREELVMMLRVKVHLNQKAAGQ